MQQIAEVEPQGRANILRLADAFCKATGYTIGTASRRAHSDAKFLENLRARKVSVTFRVHDKIVRWFVDNWPEEADFPRLDDLTYDPTRIPHGTTQKGRCGTEKARSSAEGQDGADPQAGSGTASAAFNRIHRR